MFDESIVKLTIAINLTRDGCLQGLLCGVAIAACSATAIALGSIRPSMQTIACLFNSGTGRYPNRPLTP
jgi:hypothetical protein